MNHPQRPGAKGRAVLSSQDASAEQAEPIVVATDLPTQCGYDSDSVTTTDRVEQMRFAIDTLADMEVLFACIPVDSVDF